MMNEVEQVVCNKMLEPVFTDGRGEIFDIVEENVGHVGMVTFTPGAVRGNHYHKQSTQYSYVLEGELELTISLPNGDGLQVTKLYPGVLSVIPPGIVHTYKAITVAKMLDIVTLNRKADGYEDDTVKLS